MEFRMKTLLSLMLLPAAGAAYAHEALAPHDHPHAVSWLPSIEQVGAAALILAIAVVAIVQLRRGQRP
jgi:hypothetical protein